MNGPLLDDQIRPVDSAAPAEATSEPLPSMALGEMVCSIGGKRMYLWRAVDDEGEVLDVIVQLRRDKKAARRLLERLLKTSRSSRKSLLRMAWLPMAQLLILCTCGTCIGLAGFKKHQS